MTPAQALALACLLLEWEAAEAAAQKNRVWWIEVIEARTALEGLKTGLAENVKATNKQL